MPTAVERFWAKVDKNGPVPGHRPDLGPCWIWLAGKTQAGYGRFTVSAGKRIMAYRFAYEQAKGRIETAWEPDHICRNRACVNWAHLQLLTHKQNTLNGTSFAAVNAAKTQCNRGHKFDAKNTYINKTSGSRQCRICMRISRKAYEERIGLEHLKIQRKGIRRRHYLRNRDDILQRKAERGAR